MEVPADIIIKYLEQAIDRDMVVSDNDADQGCVSLRLLALMSIVARRNNITKKITNFLVDLNDIDMWKNIAYNTSYSFISINNYDELLMKYKTKRVLSNNDIKFIIGMDDQEKALLGSY